jgi:hypothetical protein
MVRIACGLLSSLVMLAGCTKPKPHVEIRKLASGEEVKVLGISKLKMSTSGPALVLRYQTDLNMDDESAVHGEAERIWAEFRKDAEQAQVQNAIVSANAPPDGEGVITHTRTYNFVFERTADGFWREVSRE